MEFAQNRDQKTGGGNNIKNAQQDKECFEWMGVWGNRLKKSGCLNDGVEGAKDDKKRDQPNKKHIGIPMDKHTSKTR